MLIKSINNISFKRALKSDEIKNFNAVRDEAKQLVGQTGKSIFIVHDTCLPQSSISNTGVGNLSSSDAQDFFTYMKPYIGFNAVEVLPAGEIKPNNGFYCPYSSSSLSLGSHQINLELLMQDEFGKILLAEEYKQVVNSNCIEDKNTITNHKNVIGEKSPHEEALKKAYSRFKNLKEETQLKKKFKKFTSENNDWLEPKAIYNILTKANGTDDYWYWKEIDRQLYNPFVNKDVQNKRISQIINQNPEEIEYYKFKQFLAEEHLAIGRKKLNTLGVKLIGDCEINFSKDELWANPLAFKEGEYIGNADWKVPCLNFDSIIENKESSAAKLLKQKVQLNAKRYDSIRFDAGWAYVRPKIFRIDGSYYTQNFEDSILNFIENSVKEIKGQDYNLDNLIYEFLGGKIFDGTELIAPVKKRVGIYDTVYMKDNRQDIWASNNAFLKRGWSPNKFIVGVGTHDSQPLRQIANNMPDLNGEYNKESAIDPLAEILKLNREKLQNPVEFAKAKWAEPMMAENNMMFYMDIFGRKENFNMHHLNTVVHPEKNFAYKIPANYKDLYHKAVQEGYGFNIMDSLEKIFKAKNLDKTQPKLYQKIVKFRDILYEDDNAQLIKSKMRNNKHLKVFLAIGSITVIAALTIMKLLKLKNNNASKNIEKNNVITQEKNTSHHMPIAIKNNNIQQNTLASISISFNDFIKESSK